MENHKVTVAIPTYNRKEYLKEAIESVLKQSYPNIEIIICDNCSEDGTGQVVEGYCKKYNNIRYFRQKENVGARRNWEKCLELATGKYCLILSDDDVLFSDAILKMVESFTVEDVLVIGDVCIFNEKGIVTQKLINPPGQLTEEDFWKARLKLGYHDTPSGVMYLTDLGREAFEKVEQAGSAMDVAMDFLLAKDGKVHCISEMVVKYRVHGGNDTNNIYRCASSHVGFFILMKNYAPNDECIKYLHDYCKHVVLGYACQALKQGDVYLSSQCVCLLDGTLCKNYLHSWIIFFKQVLLCVLGKLKRLVGKRRKS